MSRKKLFIIIAVVLIVFILALVAYYFIITQSQTNPNGAPSGFSQFFPFGGNKTTTTTTNPTGEVTQNATSTSNYTQKLREIWSEPVAGFGLLDTKDGTTVRHVEVATGYVFETELFSTAQNRISNKTIPLTYNAVWGNSNKSFVSQYLESDNNTVDTYVMTINNKATSTENAIDGFSLAKNVNGLSVLGNNIFYLQDSGNGTQGFISGIDGLKRKQIWNSPLREILPQIVNDTTVAVSTKPYPGVGGYLYTINTTTGTVKKLLGNIAGLSALVSNDVAKVLYLSQSATANMFLYNKKGDSSQSLTPATFPEKCVWSKKDATIVYCAVPKENLDGASLTNWYMGTASFSDSIWKYDLKKNTSSLIEDLTGDSGVTIDVVKPLLSDSEKYLVFINKIDGSLWGLDLTK